MTAIFGASARSPWWRFDWATPAPVHRIPPPVTNFFRSFHYYLPRFPQPPRPSSATLQSDPSRPRAARTGRPPLSAPHRELASFRMHACTLIPSSNAHAIRYLPDSPLVPIWLRFVTFLSALPTPIRGYSPPPAAPLPLAPGHRARPRVPAAPLSARPRVPAPRRARLRRHPAPRRAPRAPARAPYRARRHPGPLRARSRVPAAPLRARSRVPAAPLRALSLQLNIVHLTRILP